MLTAVIAVESGIQHHDWPQLMHPESKNQSAFVPSNHGRGHNPSRSVMFLTFVSTAAIASNRILHACTATPTAEVQTSARALARRNARADHPSIHPSPLPAAMGDVSSKQPARAASSELQGSITPCASSSNGGQCRRVCVAVVAGGRRRVEKRACAVGDRRTKRAACVDACACACEEVLKVPLAGGVGKWWRGMQRAEECRRDCVPACDQPGRVARSQFSAPL